MGASVPLMIIGAPGDQGYVVRFGAYRGQYWGWTVRDFCPNESRRESFKSHSKPEVFLLLPLSLGNSHSPRGRRS